jgi:alkaline phosphatase D
LCLDVITDHFPRVRATRNITTNLIRFIPSHHDVELVPASLHSSEYFLLTMALSGPEWIAALSSTLLRVFVFIFLRWVCEQKVRRSSWCPVANTSQIPGHHLPPLILTTLSVYLTTIFTRSGAFGLRPLTLEEAFPRLFHHDKQAATEIVPVKENELQENDREPTLYEDEKHVIKILGFGIPDWRDPGFSYLTIFTNVLLALLAVDLIFRGPLLHPAKDLRFSRVGFVDDTSAKVLFREPDPSQLPVYAYLKGTHDSRWTTTDQIYFLDEDTDYTHPITFEGLVPDTLYTYSLSNELSGTFTTAPAPGSVRANSLVFLTSSCIKANFPYRLTTNSLSIHGFEHLPKILRSLPSPASFMLFLGDFIYVDVPLRLSSSLRHYRAEYRRVYASPSWSLPGVSTLPWLHTLDDHEIANDWSAGNDTDPFPAASDPFIHYHVAANPPTPVSAATGSNTTYFEYSRGPASFFMLDTRRYRTDPEPAMAKALSNKPLYGSSITPSNPPADRSNHTMLGAQQLSALLAFLAAPPPRNVHWKIIASSVPFTKNWRFGTPDTWGGFPSERAQVLEAMHRAERELGVRVVVLSGDRHEFAAIRFPPPIISYNPSSSIETADTVATSSSGSRVVYDRTPASGPHEFSVGPLSMFYLPLRTFRQVDEEDVAIKYLPDGNSKVGAVEIRNLEGKAPRDQKSMLRYTLWVDGEVAWEYVLTSPAPGYLEGPETRRGLTPWA